MDLKCQCPHCGTKIRYQVELSSTLANCPGCKTQFQLPDAPAGTAGAPAGIAPGAIPPTGAAQQFVPSGRGGIGLAFADPMDSQAAAMDGLGKEGTLTWGFMFCVAFPIAGWLAFWRGANMFSALMTGGLGGGAGSGFGKPKFLDHLETVTELTIFVALLFGVLFILNAMHGRKAPMRAVLFTCGMILLPMVLLSLYAVGISYLKIKSSDAMEVIGYVTTFLTLLTMSSVFLLIFASVTSVFGYTRKAGFWITPAVLMVTFVIFIWISKLTSEIGKMGN